MRASGVLSDSTIWFSNVTVRSSSPDPVAAPSSSWTSARSIRSNTAMVDAVTRFSPPRYVESSGAGIDQSYTARAGPCSRTFDEIGDRLLHGGEVGRLGCGVEPGCGQ